MSSLLSTDVFLVSPSGDKVSLHHCFATSLSSFLVNLGDLEGKTVALYFAANWYPKCEKFTQLLATVYHQLREQGSEFEVIFVTSDENLASFEQFHGSMPWLAIPFNDLQSKRYLTQKFQIEGIPSLVILDSTGESTSTDGVELVRRYGVRAFPFTAERIAQLEAEEKQEHASQTLEKLLTISGRDYFINHEDKVSFSALVGKTIGLYFSAAWCPPCLKFTARLKSIYDNLKEKNEEFEIVFVSLDRDEEGFSQSYSDMPWLALPFNTVSPKPLVRYFNIQAIPALVVIGPDGKTVTKEGRNLINLHKELAYPFDEAQIQLLNERIDEEAKQYPNSFNHEGHRHLLNIVSEKSGGGPYMCCECDEQGLGWAYQCLGCGYEIHLKCGRRAIERQRNAGDLKASADQSSSCAVSGSRGN